VLAYLKEPRRPQMTQHPTHLAAELCNHCDQPTDEVSLVVESKDALICISDRIGRCFIWAK
jgi:hypothetical protein